jgi:branched-chain amino acid transport system permease protein
MGVFGYLLDMLVLRRMFGQSQIAVVILTIALGFVLRFVAGTDLGPRAEVARIADRRQGCALRRPCARPRRGVIIVVTLLLTVVLYFYFNRTASASPCRRRRRTSLPPTTWASR